MLNTKAQSIRTRLSSSASALAFICAIGAANAATITLDGTNTPWNLGSDNVSDTLVVKSGSSAAVGFRWGTYDAGTLLAYWPDKPNGTGTANNLSADSYVSYNDPGNSVANVDKIQVESGATLRIDNPWGWVAYQSMFNVSGDTIMTGGANFNIMGTNSFLGNLTIGSGAGVIVGQSWATSQFNLGSATNLVLDSGSSLDLYLPGTFTANMGGALSGSGSLTVRTGTFMINGANTNANPFTGTITLGTAATLVVGDATHTSAALGDPGNPAAHTLAVTGNSGGAPILRGTGTIYANVVNSAGIVQPGYGGSALHSLTVSSYSQDNTGTLKVEVNPDSVAGLHVLGNASLGGTLNVTVDAGNYATQIYDIVQVDGTMTGDFKSITTSSAVQGAIAAVTRTDHGYQVVTQVVQGKAATAPIVVGNLVDINRLNNTYFIGSLYDRINVDSPRGDQQIGRNKYVWVEGFGRQSSVSRNDVGYHATMAGFTAGAEYRTESNKVVGVAVSYSSGDMKAKGDSTASMDAWTVAAYGGADVQYFRLDGALFYNGYSTDTERAFGTPGTAKTSPSGYAWGGSLQVSLPMFRGLVTPYLRGVLSRQHLDASVETGSPLLNLRYNAINGNYFVGDLGFRIDPLRSHPESKTKLFFTLALEHDFSALGEKVVGTFPVDNGQAWSSYWRGDSENTGVVGIDVARQITDKLEIAGRVNGRFSLYQTSGELALNAKYRF
jgi:hypothetical protein